MSSFKNFFITFIICLLIFGFVGFKFVYPALTEVADIDEVINPKPATSGDTSEESGDTSTEPSTPVIIDDEYDEKGDIFTVAVACVDERGRALACAFIDANGKSKQFIICSVPSSARVVNEAGVSVPIGDIYPSITDSGVCSAFSALTGLPTDYSIRVDREALKTLVSLMPSASAVLSETISFVNPKYADFQPADGEAYPDDYYITITNADGRVKLNEKIQGKTKLDWLLEYSPNADGSEYNGIYISIAKSVLRQFFESEGSLKNTSTLSKFLAKTETNLTADALSTHLDTIFSYKEFRVHDVSYPGNWEKATETLRGIDARRE